MLGIIIDIFVACAGGIAALIIKNPYFTLFYVIILFLILAHNYARKKSAKKRANEQLKK